jgi:glycosyltransferase involved in cell wall biosynthesis
MNRSEENIKRVIIIVENLPVPNDRRVWLEANTLRNAGYQVSIVSIKGKNAMKSYECLDGIHIYRYPAPPSTQGTMSFLIEFSYCWIMSFLLSLYIFFRRGFDVIHACNPPETFWLIGVIYKLLGVKFIFDHHDLSPEMYLSRFGRKGLAYKTLIFLERMTFKTADLIITTNDTHKQIAITRGGYNPRKIFIVRSGPDLKSFQSRSPEASLKKDHSYMVSYLGVLNPQDGVDLLITTIDYIVHELSRNDILFVIMGAGDAEEDLKKQTEKLKLSEFIHFTGWVDIDMILRYLSTSDICVDSMPKNPYSDAATTNKVLEYMAIGKPIVTFDLVETRLSAQEAALYAQPDDIKDLAIKIVKLIDDEDLRMKMGEFGRRRIITELSWEHQQETLINAYRNLLYSSV